MSAEPSICRRYHSPRDSDSSSSDTSKVDTPSGKWPHMMTEWLQTLRSTLAAMLAVRVDRKDPVGSEATGWRT